MEPCRRVGVLGTGIMGKPMALNLARAGFDVAAWNRTTDKTTHLAEAGIKVADTAAEAAARREAVVVMLSSGSVCAEILFGEHGAAAAMDDGALLIVMSSIGVAEANDLARRGEANNLRWLDAPVSGGETGAKDGTLSIMAGGSAADFADAADIFAPMGRAIHIGPTGTGALTKLVNQLTVASTIAAVSEAILLAKKGGADLARVREALLGGFAQSKVLEQHGQRMIEGNFAPGGPAKYQVKDTQAACAVARELGLDLPMLELTDRLFSDLVAAGGGDLDHSALFLEMQRRSGCLAEGNPLKS